MQFTIRTALAENFRETMDIDADRPESFAIARVDGPTIRVDVAPGSSVEGIAEAAWSVGNRMTRDADGQAWPANVRSMSVGDMVIIQFRTAEIMLVAVDFGFRIVPSTVRPAFDIKPRSSQGERGPWSDAGDEVIAGAVEGEFGGSRA